MLYELKVNNRLIFFYFMHFISQQMDKCDCVLHIVPDKKGFQQQKIDLGLQMLVEGMPKQVCFNECVSLLIKQLPNTCVQYTYSC